jgi:hypothetical protein
MHSPPRLHDTTLPRPIVIDAVNATLLHVVEHHVPLATCPTSYVQFPHVARKGDNDGRQHSTRNQI